MGENIHLEKHVADGVAVIRLDRPKVNALSSDMMRDLHTICDELTVDDTTRAVVVTGGRKNFAAGADISEFPSFTAETAQQFSNLFNDALLALEILPKVTISAINGFALGGGLEVDLVEHAATLAARALPGTTCAPRPSGVRGRVRLAGRRAPRSHPPSRRGSRGPAGAP